MATNKAEAKALKKLGLPTIEEFMQHAEKAKELGFEIEGLDEAAVRPIYDSYIAQAKQDLADEAEAKKVDAAEKTDSDLSYPAPLGGNRAAKVLRGKWRDQGRVKCDHPKCYYPLNLTKNEKTGDPRTPYEVPSDHEHAGEAAYLAECSWDPRHMRREDETPQYILHTQLFPPDDPGDADLE